MEGSTPDCTPTRSGVHHISSNVGTTHVGTGLPRPQRRATEDLVPAMLNLRSLCANVTLRDFVDLCEVPCWGCCRSVPSLCTANVELSFFLRAHSWLQSSKPEHVCPANPRWREASLSSRSRPSSRWDLWFMLTARSPPMNRWAEFRQPRKAGRSLRARGHNPDTQLGCGRRPRCVLCGERLLG